MSAKVDEVEVFLEHFGVRGMRWGARKERRGQESIARFKKVADGTASKKDREGVRKSLRGNITKSAVDRELRIDERKKSGRAQDPADKAYLTAERNRKIARNVNTALYLAAGAMFVASMISSSKGNTRARSAGSGGNPFGGSGGAKKSSLHIRYKKNQAILLTIHEMYRCRLLQECIKKARWTKTNMQTSQRFLMLDLIEKSPKLY